MLHTLDVSKNFDRVLIKTVDRDVVLMMTAAYQTVMDRVWKREIH